MTTRFHAQALWVAAACAAVGLFWLWAPPSVWLVRLSPDGTLDPSVERFLDGAWVLALGAALLALLYALVPRFADAVRAATQAKPPADRGTTRAKSLIWTMALLATLARLIVGALSDAGLGDDGARNVWLEQWLADPHFISGGLWAPGHLYLQALLWLPLRDVVHAGTALSALASGGIVALLGLGALRDWGLAAGLTTALLVGILPISVAYGSTSDVNPLFALAMLVAVACATRGRDALGWLVLSWLGVGLAAWCRFETFLLVPAVALLLWPRWRRLLVFAAACGVAVASWTAVNWMSSGDVLHVYNAVQADPTLAVSRVSALFDLLGAGWRCITLPVALLAIMGVVRALREQRGRAWLPVGIFHLMALLAATLSAGTGNQARYLILAASILCYYAGVALSGMLSASRAWGSVLLALAVALVILLPGRHPDRRGLWIQRDARLRGIADCVRQAPLDGALVWIANEAAYFFPLRTGFPVDRYYAMSRADSDAAAIATTLRDEPRVWLCVRDEPLNQAQMQALLQAGDWTAGEPSRQCDDYSLYRLQRDARPRGLME